MLARSAPSKGDSPRSNQGGRFPYVYKFKVGNVVIKAAKLAKQAHYHPHHHHFLRLMIVIIIIIIIIIIIVVVVVGG